MSLKEIVVLKSYDPSKRYTQERNGADYAKFKASTIKNTEKLKAQEDESCRLQAIVDSYSSTKLELEDELHHLYLSFKRAIEAEKERKRKHRDEMAQKVAKEAVHVAKKVQLETQSKLKTEEILQLRVRNSVLKKKLLRTDPHVVKTFTWIQHNKDLFKGEVYNPALSPMTLKDNRYADQVEAIIGPANLTQFICEFEVDYKVLRTAINTLEYRVHIIWTDFSTEHDYSKTSLEAAELEPYRNMHRFSPKFCYRQRFIQIHTTSDNHHSGQSKMNILPSIYLQMGVCQRSIEDLQREIEDLQAKLIEESQAIPSDCSSVKESDISMSEEIDNPKKRSFDYIKEITTKLDAAKESLEKQNKETDDLVTSGEYFNTLRDFMASDIF
ncbi:hypothetical protein V8B55DRAFT_1465341 [Mucor lusitanicus]